MKKLLTYLGMMGFAATLVAQPAYDVAKMQKEKLGRGLVAVRQSPKEVCVTWRYLSSDDPETAFLLYRNGVQITKKALKESTYFVDKYSGKELATYELKAVKGGQVSLETAYRLPENAPLGYLNIPLNQPQAGKTPAGDTYTYSPNDAGVADVDADGSMEILVKWEPSNAHDNAHDGYTGSVLFDCYRLDGTFLWRIDLGRNVRAGAHYTQFMFFDLNGDNKAELVLKTSDGTVDGRGKVIGEPSEDYREPGEDGRNQGRILTGNEFLTVFSGETGEALYTAPYVPSRGRLMSWGDNRANRSDRFLACVAYLDGIRPSVVMCRGYYTRTTLVAYDWDGKELKKRWMFDSNTPANKDYAGQGNHNLRVGDVDGDGCDEIIYGSCAIDHNGSGLYSTGMGHGDAMHLTAFDPQSAKLQVWDCHENKRDGSTLRDAATGEVLFQVKSTTDVGRAMAADIDPNSPGVEMWSLASGGIRNIKGEVVAEQVKGLSTNMAVWWDGDLLRELLDRNVVSKYDWKKKECKPLTTFTDCVSNNGTKSNPSLQADIVGDWREEVLIRTADNSALRLYVSPFPTRYRFHSFLEDPVYRISIATQNVAYNQPTQAGFYFGTDLKKGTNFRGTTIK